MDDITVLIAIVAPRDSSAFSSTQSHSIPDVSPIIASEDTHQPLTVLASTCQLQAEFEQNIEEDADITRIPHSSAVCSILELVSSPLKK